MLDLKHDSVATLGTMLVITSTYGNGDPPSNAEDLHAYLMKKAPPMPDLKFSVCALGDTTYERFAQCGKDFDRRLGELGATRIAPRKDCDVDYDDAFEAWFAEVCDALGDPAVDNAAPVSAAPAVEKHVDALGTRRNPVSARVLVNDNLNGAGSSKETRHIVLSLKELPIRYECGDSIGVWPENDPALVAEVLRETKLTGDESVVLGEVSAPLRELLSRKLEIQEPDPRLFERAKLAKAAELHVIDVLARPQPAWTAQELVQHLRPASPRLYSIASSPKVHPNEVHLLVSVVRFQVGEAQRGGVTTRYLAERAPVGSTVSIYHHPGPAFRLAPRDRDIIMIGPGTGVAPFRAFLEERERVPGSGRSWLFFGARNRATDFLYQQDFERMLRGGALTKLDVAFSRDQAQKLYVQHRLLEHREELAAWISAGACVYVCGDAKHMAHDVHEALSSIVDSQTLTSMALEGSYLRDVY